MWYIIGQMMCLSTSIWPSTKSTPKGLVSKHLPRVAFKASLVSPQAPVVSTVQLLSSLSSVSPMTIPTLTLNQAKGQAITLHLSDFITEHN